MNEHKLFYLTRESANKSHYAKVRIVGLLLRPSLSYPNNKRQKHDGDGKKIKIKIKVKNVRIKSTKSYGPEDFFRLASII